MVNRRPRNRIKKSLSRIRSSISNTLKKSNYFQKSKKNPTESDSQNSVLEVSSVLEDDDGFYDTCDNNVQEPNLSSESTSPNFQYSHTHYHPKDNLYDVESNHENYKKLKSLEKEELERICKEYSERNGTEFLEVGLRTYIDAVIDTKNFRNRCFQVLSRRPYLPSKYTMDHYHLRNYQNYLISNLNNENYKNKKTLDLRNYRTSSDSAHLSPNKSDTILHNTNKQTFCTRCSLTPSNHKLTPMRGNMRLNRNKLTPQKLTPTYFNNNQNKDNLRDLNRDYLYSNLNPPPTFGNNNNYINKDYTNNYQMLRKYDDQFVRKEHLLRKADNSFETQGRELLSLERSTSRYTNKEHVVDDHFNVHNHPEDEEIDLNDFISRYNYLNSDQKDTTPNLKLDSRKSNKDNNFNISSTQNKDLEYLENDVDALSHDEKLKLLEKIGIEDDYIAKRVCSKFSGRLKNNKPEKKSLEEFNLFHKENLKHQLDVNYQLSQEIIHLSNLNTPDRSCSSEGRSRRRRYSLFDRISSTIDRNKDTSPTDIMNLTIS